MAYQSGRHFLQIPGPTNVPDRVLRAMAAPTIDHRGPDFADMARHVLAGDEVHAIEVTLYTGHLSSRDDDEVLAGANRIAVETDAGDWEVIAFAGVELVAPQTYRAEHDPSLDWRWLWRPGRNYCCWMNRPQDSIPSRDANSMIN